MTKITSVIFFVVFFSFGVFSQEIILNEIMSSNSGTIPDDDGEYSDWIEIYNYGKLSVNLKGFGLSDSPKKPLKWVFPDINIQSEEYLLVWASGKNRDLHTNFKIGASGESVVLADPKGAVIDELPEKALQTDISCGRKPDNTKDWFLFVKPTPGEKNLTAEKNDILEPPEFTTAPGIYDKPVTLYRPKCDENVIIRYTLNGSEPTDSSPIFKDSLYLTDRSDLENDVANIATIESDNKYFTWKKPSNVAKGTVVRMAAFCDRFITSPTVTGTFFIFDKGTKRYSLPIVSVVSDKKNFFGKDSGIYIPGNYNHKGEIWERKGNIEFFNTNGLQVLSCKAGYRIHGNGTRSFPQKSLRIYHRDELDCEAFEYPFFSNKSSNSFKRLILRNSGNDFGNTMFRDGIAHILANHLRFETQGFAPHIVFINGEYWGIQNLRERYDKHYLQRVYGIDPDNIDYLSISNNAIEISEGDDLFYKEMIEFVQNNNMAETPNYEKLKTYIDIDNFIEYLSANIYLQNHDWINNNISFWRLRKKYTTNAPKGHDGRFRMMMYDTDFTFKLHENHGPDMIDFIIKKDYPLTNSLLTNSAFRTAFINSQADLLNSTFHEQRALFKVDSIQKMLEPEIEEHVQRWSYPESKDVWLNNVEKLKEFMRDSPSQMYKHLKKHFQLSDTTKVTIENDITKGFIKINSLVLNEELSGVNEEKVYPWTGIYLKGNPIRLQALCKEGFELEKWIINDTEYTDKIIEIDPVDNLVINTVYIVDTESTINTIIFKPTINTIHPNPFSEKTLIKFSLSQNNNVKINIYDINGKLLIKIFNKYLHSGSHHIFFNGEGLKSGIYLCALNVGNKVSVKKIQVIR